MVMKEGDPMRKKLKLIIPMLLLIIVFILLLKYHSNKIVFTAEEKAFIKNHPEIALAPDPNFAPIEFFNDEGIFNGISSDYVQWINDNTELNIVIKTYDSWDQIIQAIKSKKIDMLSGVVPTEEREKFLNFSEAFIELPTVIITRKNFIDFQMTDIENMSLAVVDSYFTDDFLSEKYPNKNIVKVKTVLDGIKLVSFGQVDAYVESLGAISYYLEESGISNIKVAGEFEESSSYHFAVRDDYEILISILNKAIEKIPENEKADIFRKWVTLYPESTIINQELFITILIITGILVLISILSFTWNYTLKKEVARKASIIEKLNKNEKRKLKKIVKEKTEELEQTNKELLVAERIALVGRLVSGVAHEVNTPLGVAITAATHLKNKNSKLNQKLVDGTLTKYDLELYISSVEETTDILNLNLEKAGALIKNFKKIAVNQNIDEKTDFNLSEHIDSTILSLNYKLKKTNCNIQVICPKNINIYSHPGFFSQILTNFIMNSINHGFVKDKGNITIVAKIVDEKLLLEYSDDGSGIEEQHLDKIFEPFFTTTRNKGGSGLGLNIVYNIVTSKLKGTIDVSSSIGKGVKFSIQIPIEQSK